MVRAGAFSMAVLLGAGAANAMNAQTLADVALRVLPSEHAQVVDTIPTGSEVTAWACAEPERWCAVRWQGSSGWVPGDLLARTYGQHAVFVMRTGAAVVVSSPEPGADDKSRRVVIDEHVSASGDEGPP